MARLLGRWASPAWIALSVIGLFAVPYIVWVNRAKPTILGFDGYATWALDFGHLYAIPYMDLAAFRYTPAYAEAFAWAGALPWELFAALWIGATFAVLVYWARWWALALVALPPVALELYHGNIHVLMAAAMVAGLRHPAAWAFPLLAKVTPGIGLLWFVGRREWRNLAIALGSTAAIVVVSIALAPHYWSEWVTAMSASLSFVPPRTYPIDIPFAVRAPVAAAIALWGGMTNRPWTVPVAALVGAPIIWVHGFSMLVALIPLTARDGLSTTRPSFVRPMPRVAIPRLRLSPVPAMAARLRAQDGPPRS